MQEVISKLMKTGEAPGDYTGDDGLLHCGKCHTPKQTRLSFNPATGDKVPTIVRAVCQCQREADEAENRRAKREQFMQDMARRREDGISCPDGLRHTFAQDDRAEPKVSDACRRYVEHWKEMRAENIGILFHGTVGTGKSFYASCIGNGLLDRRVPVAATNFPRLLNLLQGSQEKQKLLDRLAIYKLLILDDLGVERDSAYSIQNSGSREGVRIAERSIFDPPDYFIGNKAPNLIQLLLYRFCCGLDFRVLSLLLVPCVCGNNSANQIVHDGKVIVRQAHFVASPLAVCTAR